MSVIDYNMGILIVDDSTSMRRIVKKFLFNNEFSNFYEAADGHQALDVLKKESIDLIICDLNMPNMDGLTLLEIVKKDDALKNIPFIILTVEAIQRTMNKALALNVDSYIVKPVEEKVFIAEMRRVLEGMDDEPHLLL